MTRILIADPDPASRKALALLLTRKLGVEIIIEATEAESLSALIKATLPDVLLLDDNLPGLNYPVACPLLQKAFPKLKIALLSLDETARYTAASCGIEFIHKGDCMDETIARLQALLGNTK
jgi:DNA-binding NarL/FixJ family response regulator